MTKSEQRDYILDKGWTQSGTGDSSRDVVWKDPTNGTIKNLSTAVATQKIRDERAGVTTVEAPSETPTEEVTEETSEEVSETSEDTTDKKKKRRR